MSYKLIRTRMAAFQTKHVSPVKHTCSVWQPRKAWVTTKECEFHFKTDARQSDPFMYVCYAFQATQKLLFGYRYNFLKKLKLMFGYRYNFLKLDMSLWNMDAPGVNEVKIWQKSLSPTFWPHTHP